MIFSIIQIAQAHEEGATSVTPDNITGPILALIIIVLAVVTAKRISAGDGSRPEADQPRAGASGGKNIKITTNKHD